jgi:LacI family transcriptional regulator
MAVTIYDVAKKAGVGIGTVSRAINNSPRISSQTKTKVDQAIHELKYQPHALAQGLARKKTNMVAIIVPVFTGYFYLELLRGIQQEISKYRYDLLLFSVDQTEKTEIFLKRTLQERKVDGVLLISLSISDHYVKKFLHSQFPIVLIDSDHNGLDSLTVENEQGAYLATKHLISLGHTRIGMIDAQLKSIPAKMRLEGYQKALRDHRISYNRRYLVISDSDIEKDGFNREAGYTAMKQLLQMNKDRPTAVFVSSDIQAAGAIKAIKEYGLNIPEDISVIGFDDIELAQYMGLSTVRQPMYEMGKMAVEVLMKKMSGEESKPIKKRFETRLVIRDSCGYRRMD